ncbi:cell division protein ZapE [Thiohalobacter sp. IOR34]|uniref:cell division protein ZapE n=1 Tax=Thiohalobacter sp. IOR34 TaxID=3057176 RepID=UPI0025B13E95|nr:cell division protein ZapE [Thiohalobacter sp. IOR34]WJW76091.1 cell division protein ZapE [Thiohalobacter sp. IOR34]
MTAPAGPRERYALDLRRGDFLPDPAQAEAVEQLQQLYEALLTAAPGRWWQRLLGRRPPPLPGLYLWGGTGRGKTYLMDSFHDCLPFTEKRRVHFHRFMQDIHAELRRLPKTPNPLALIARRLAAEVRVLCVDEFHVHDIADAMLLGGLLQAMFERGIVLVATSNVAIDDLYLDGLQRDRFLFAIELLQRHTRSVRLAGEQDFRFRRDQAGSAYRCLQGAAAEAFLEQLLAEAGVSPGGGVFPGRHRRIPVRAMGEGIAWFDFAALCEAPLWAADYLDLAQSLDTLLLGGVPQMGEEKDDAAKRFMHLVDALYDQRVRLVLTAEVPAEQLYTGRYLRFAFRRTVSRLAEMDSRNYQPVGQEKGASPAG